MEQLMRVQVPGRGVLNLVLTSEFVDESEFGDTPEPDGLTNPADDNFPDVAQPHVHDVDTDDDGKAENVEESLAYDEYSWDDGKDLNDDNK